MRKFIIENQKTKARKVAKETNKSVLSILFNSAISNWETKSRSWREYCRKYPTVQQYDKHLDALEKDEKKEFFADIVNNTNLYSHMYKIIDVIIAEQELTL